MTNQWKDRPWVSFYEEYVPHHFVPSELTMVQMLRRTVQEVPKQPAMLFLGRRTSYETLWDQTQRLASALQRMGIKRGDRVAVMLPNCPQFVVSTYGILSAGAVMVNCSPLSTPSELEEQLSDSGAETLIILDRFYKRYEEIKDRVSVRRVLFTGIQEALPFPKNLLYPLKAKKEGAWVKVRQQGHVLPFAEVIASQSPYPEAVSIQSDDLAVLQYTGGTTGTPKAAMLSHKNLVSNAQQAQHWLGYLKYGQESILAAVPFFHIYGLTSCVALSVLMAAQMVIVPDPRNLPMLLSELQRSKASIFPGVPTLYNAINNYPKIHRYDLSHVRACISGSAPLMAETARQFKRITGGAQVVEGYGLTEASPVTHANPMCSESGDGIGYPFTGIDVLVMDDNHNPVPVGESGELWISGSNVMQGYWNRPEETAQTLVSYEGKTWLKTGDIVKMNKDGYTWIIDRKKDLIISGGHNIYPREVEDVLMTHPAIQEAAVIGVPDAYRGENVQAVVVTRPGMTVTEDELRQFAREYLSPYKVPRVVEFRDELPKSAMLKVLRRVLAAEARERIAQQKETPSEHS